VRFLVDARPALDPRRTGVGQYAANIVRHLPVAAPDDEIVAWYLDVRGVVRRAPRFPGVARLTEHASRLPARLFQPFSRRTGLPRVEWLAGSFEALLATNFLPPPTRIPGVVPVVHDLAFDLYPETAPHVDRRWRERFARQLERAARVIVPSGATRDDLIKLHEVDPARIDVIHHGTDAHAFRPAPDGMVDEVRRRHGIEGPYVLFLGGLEPRKNLEALVRAFGKASVDASLVIAGGQVRWFPEAADRVERAIEDLPVAIRARVVKTGYVRRKEKLALLSGAQVLAYPSLYEGFGLPVLEAFAASIPVLTSNVSSLPEVAGDAAMLVDPHDPAAMADGLEQLCRDEDLRRVLAAAGTARVASFTWDRSARATVDTLRRAAQPSG
jgi:glycosyltransferase involved in cell wall biosynthesis